MALIKCSECGNEISDKATSCIHCGCPITNNKNTEERVIAKTIINKECINRLKMIMGCVLGGIWVLYFLFISSLGGGTGVKLSLAFMAVCLLLSYFLIVYVCNNYLKAELVLTNKRIYGKCFANVFGIVQIDFPLNKVSSIIKEKITSNDNVTLGVATSSGHYVIRYVSNADEFKEAFFKEIQ